jgi:DNA-binding transcriptional LysR family regulator
MDLRHAKTFVTVAELGTVSKAAQHLRIAQPALSRQISGLEQDLGIKLFDRVGRRLMLTGEGEQLLGDCRALLNCATAVGERAQQLQHGDKGVLRVAASPQIIEGTISEFLRRYAQHYPKVQVKLIEAIGWADIVGMLERGDIHLGQNLMRAVQPDDRRFERYLLESVDLLAAHGSTITLGNHGKIEIARLAAYPLLLLDTSYVFRRNFDAACRLAGLEPIIAYESRTPHTLLAMAESGHGVAVIPSAMRTDRHPLRIATVTYRGKPLREPLAIYWDKRRTLPRYATAFCEMLGGYMREVFPISRPTKTGKSSVKGRRTAGRIRGPGVR